MGDSIFYKKTIKDIDLAGKVALLRADYNVPMENGKITDDYRIKKSLPTIQYLLERDCKVVICSHLGRPSGKDDLLASLEPIAKRLANLLKKNVGFVNDCVSDQAKKCIEEMNSKDVLVLENLRYYPEEEKNDHDFARRLAEGIDIFVQDGFGVLHRAHASTDAITKFLPSVAGFLVEAEMTAINRFTVEPQRPLMVLVGGAKIGDKIDFIDRFVDFADIVAIGGAMSNTFLLAEGIGVGESLAEPEEVPLAKKILEKARKKAKQGEFVFYVPQDGVVSKKMESNTTTRIVDWGTHIIADIESYPKKPTREAGKIGRDEQILDIGPFSGAFIAGSMQLANTVIWNGAMGVTEIEGLLSASGPFSHGTELVVEALLGKFGHRPQTFVGGGDTAGYIEQRSLVEHFDHVSTGGGASMELMSGKKLPGIEALLDKDK